MSQRFATSAVTDDYQENEENTDESPSEDVSGHDVPLEVVTEDLLGKHAM